MEKSKYNQLKDAIHTYGAAAFENLLRCKGLGQAIVDNLHGYIECPREMVRAVPAQGEFDPKKDYGDEAFSFSRRPVIVLEPVHFGLTLIVGNAEDSGLLWLRTNISIEVTGDTFDVFVANQPVIRVPLQFDGHLTPVFEAVFREFIRTFEMEVMEFNDARFKNGICFIG
ncbi:MAG: hypothetical protein AAGH42_10680 [Pseudomonadota bacterium]